MGWLHALDVFHDKIDPLDALIQKNVLGNQQQQEHFIGTYGPIIGAAFTGGALAPAAAGTGGAAAGMGGAAGSGITAGAGGGLMAAGSGGAAGMGGALGSGISAGSGGLMAAGSGAAGMGEALGAGLSGGIGYSGAGAGAGGLSGMQAFMDTIKPYKQAFDAANSVKQATSSNQQLPPAPQPLTPMPNSTLGQMVSGMEQNQQNQMALEQQRRQMRRQMRTGMV